MTSEAAIAKIIVLVTFLMKSPGVAIKLLLSNIP